MGGRHRPGDPRGAHDARHEDVLRLQAGVRRRAEHAHLPRVPGDAGRAARAEPRRHRVHRAGGPGHELRHREALDVLPQDLHVPRHVEELPDHAGPGGLLHARAPGPRRGRRGREGARRPGRPCGGREPRQRDAHDRRLHRARGHHAHPHGGGRGQDGAHRRRRGPHRRRHALARGLQPRGHPAHRARHRARPAHARGGAPVHAEAAPDLPGAGHLGLLDGGGLHALRRQRVAYAAAGPRSSA